MTINEAGIVTDENEGIVNGSKKYTTADNLIGFIYLDEAPSSTNNTYNNPTNSNNTHKDNLTQEEKLDPNNNLKELNIDIDAFVFDASINDYELEVPYETQIIHIKATPESSNAIVTGTGAKALKVGTNEYTITVTAEDKTTKEYHITVTRKEPIIKEDTKEQKNPNIPKYVIIGPISGGVIILIVSTILIVKKKRKRRVNNE